MAATFTLVPEAVQGVVQRSGSVPSSAPSAMLIEFKSTVFGADATLSFDLMVEESFDSGVTWTTASGFPMQSIGGTAGTIWKGVASTGLPTVRYYFDGRARQLRATGTPYVSGPPHFTTQGPYDWGLTATVL